MKHVVIDADMNTTNAMRGESVENESSCLRHAHLVVSAPDADVVAMNDLSSRKIKGVSQLTEEAGADALCPPPYSANLDPIDKAWSIPDSKGKNTSRGRRDHSRSPSVQYASQRKSMIQPLLHRSTVKTKVLQHGHAN
jgi:hypothetical protein